MKIGIEVQRLFRKKRYGIEVAAAEWISKLTAIDSSNEYILFTSQRGKLPGNPNNSSLSVQSLPGKVFVDFEQGYLPLASWRGRIDLLHCTGNTAPYFCPVPLVQTLHDTIFMDPATSAQDPWYRRVGNIYRRKLVPMITSRSEAIITVSEYVKNKIVNELGIDGNKIYVIYNGLNEQRFRVQDDPMALEHVRCRYALPPAFILYLGNETMRKNPERTLEAYCQYVAKSDAPLPLVTPGLSRHFIRRKLSKLNALQNETYVTTPGYIRDEDLPGVYSMSRMFLFPSLAEGFGMPVIEAMACGTPVITSHTTSLPEIAGDAAWFVNPYNPGEIAEALLLLEKETELRKEKIQRGLVHARRFSWTKAAEQILEVYHRVHYTNWLKNNHRTIPSQTESSWPVIPPTVAG